MLKTIWWKRKLTVNQGMHLGFNTMSRWAYASMVQWWKGNGRLIKSDKIKLKICIYRILHYSRTSMLIYVVYLGLCGVRWWAKFIILHDMQLNSKGINEDVHVKVKQHIYVIYVPLCHLTWLYISAP